MVTVASLLLIIADALFDQLPTGRTDFFLVLVFFGV